MAAFDQTADDGFLVEVARFTQFSQSGEKAVILRLGERVRREQNRGEQQQWQPPPAAGSVALAGRRLLYLKFCPEHTLVLVL